MTQCAHRSHGRSRVTGLPELSRAQFSHVVFRSKNHVALLGERRRINFRDTANLNVNQLCPMLHTTQKKLGTRVRRNSQLHFEWITFLYMQLHCSIASVVVDCRGESGPQGGSGEASVNEDWRGELAWRVRPLRLLIIPDTRTRHGNREAFQHGKCKHVRWTRTFSYWRFITPSSNRERKKDMNVLPMRISIPIIWSVFFSPQFDL